MRGQLPFRPTSQKMDFKTRLAILKDCLAILRDCFAIIGILIFLGYTIWKFFIQKYFQRLSIDAELNLLDTSGGEFVFLIECKITNNIDVRISSDILECTIVVDKTKQDGPTLEK